MPRDKWTMSWNSLMGKSCSMECCGFIEEYTICKWIVQSWNIILLYVVWILFNFEIIFLILFLSTWLNWSYVQFSCGRHIFWTGDCWKCQMRTKGLGDRGTSLKLIFSINKFIFLVFYDITKTLVVWNLDTLIEGIYPKRPLFSWIFPLKASILVSFFFPT